jgi:long-chain fatty acid transport protein
VTLGATYQTKTKMGKFSKYKGLFAEQGDFDIPANFGVGIAVKAAPETVVAFDIQRIQYNGVKSVGSPLTNLTVGGNLFGSNDGAGFGWRDMTVYKLGLSQMISKELTVRAGYSHGQQPIPEAETFLNVLAPAVIQDHLTLGGTWTLANKGEVTLAYMHAFKKQINGSGSIPGAFGGGEANIKMYEDSLGIAYGWKM